MEVSNEITRQRVVLETGWTRESFQALAPQVSRAGALANADKRKERLPAKDVRATVHPQRQGWRRNKRASELGVHENR